MSFDDEAVQRYEIERIVSKRTTQQGFTEYYIKWKDYNDDENTWEPLENLIEDKAFEVIFNFENSEETKAKYPIQNRDVINFIKSFSEFDPSNKLYVNMTSSMSFGGFPLDKPERILGLEKNYATQEIYAIIECSMRENTGIKPKSTAVRTDIHSVFDPELYLDYLEKNISVQTN